MGQNAGVEIEGVNGAAQPIEKARSFLSSLSLIKSGDFLLSHN
jgi:hypothetical protein